MKSEIKRGRSDLSVRPTTVGDIPAMMELERRCATAAHWTEEQYRRLFQAESVRRLAFLIEGSGEAASGSGSQSGGNVYGFLVACRAGPDWELENIVVAPEVRRQGLGVKLLDELFARARQAETGGVFLEVRESNEVARRFYEKYGFQEAGRRRAYYSSPQEDAIVYQWEMGG
jgi:[ribosomal protein S18]-alanine N-acetyltransferase